MSYYSSFNDFNNDLSSDNSQFNFKRNRISANVKSPMMNVGGAMLIVVFVILCLTIFGFLSFTTSFADRKLIDKSIKNTTEYYAADGIAELKICEIFNYVWEMSLPLDTNINSDYVYDRLIEDGIITSDNIMYSEDINDILSLEFTFPINNTQALYVIVDFYKNESGILDYKIKDWSVFLTLDLEYTQKYDVLD